MERKCFPSYIDITGGSGYSSSSGGSGSTNVLIDAIVISSFEKPKNLENP